MRNDTQRIQYPYNVLRNKPSYKNSLPIWRAVVVSIPGKLDITGLPGYLCFLGTWTIARQRADCLSGVYMDNKRFGFEHPFKLYNIRKRGSVKKYQPPNSILFSDENNLAQDIIFLHFHQSQIVIRFP